MQLSKTSKYLKKGLRANVNATMTANSNNDIDFDIGRIRGAKLHEAYITIDSVAIAASGVGNGGGADRNLALFPKKGIFQQLELYEQGVVQISIQNGLDYNQINCDTNEVNDGKSEKLWYSLVSTVPGQNEIVLSRQKTNFIYYTTDTQQSASNSGLLNEKGVDFCQQIVTGVNAAHTSHKVEIPLKKIFKNTFVEMQRPYNFENLQLKFTLAKADDILRAYRTAAATELNTHQLTTGGIGLAAQINEVSPDVDITLNNVQIVIPIEEDYVQQSSEILVPDVDVKKKGQDNATISQSQSHLAVKKCFIQLQRKKQLGTSTSNQSALVLSDAIEPNQYWCPTALGVVLNESLATIKELTYGDMQLLKNISMYSNEFIAFLQQNGLKENPEKYLRRTNCIKLDFGEGDPDIRDIYIQYGDYQTTLYDIVIYYVGMKKMILTPTSSFLQNSGF